MTTKVERHQSCGGAPRTRSAPFGSAQRGARECREAVKQLALTQAKVYLSVAVNGVRFMNDETKVLFVCVHNAARSRVAEAYLRELGGPGFNVTSAGFEPREANPLVIDAMRMAKVPLVRTAPRPSVFELFRAGQFFHYVIAVCDEASAERCPIFPWISKRLAWSFPDPGKFTGSYEQQLAQVVAMRDAIRARIEVWLRELDALNKATQKSRPTVLVTSS